MSEIKITPSSGNVFADVGLPDSEILEMKSELMMNIIKKVQTNNLSQQAIAELLEISQPRVLDLFNGKIDLFSTDMLLRFLVRLGIRIDIYLS